MHNPQDALRERESDSTGRLTQSKRLLVGLTVLALAGVASLTLAPLGSLAPPGLSPDTFRWLALVQPAILAIGAALIGHFFAHRVGLDAPLVRAVLHRQAAGRLLLRQISAGAIGALFAGGVLIIYSAVTADSLRQTFTLPLSTRLLYGGVAEEIIARWGVMSLFVWASWRLANSSVPVQAHHFWIGNFLAALMFALGHLPILFALGDASPETGIVAAVLFGNLLTALIFGWLYSRRGLEAAMFAHAGAHVIAAALT